MEERNFTTAIAELAVPVERRPFRVLFFGFVPRGTNL